ncbi:MAG TPA: hypothetical protein VGN12_27925 [Pirellulales bacterium]|jgi:hypothetical protein
MNLLLAVVLVWTFIDQWPLRWLAWAWLIIVSLPFAVLVLTLWSLIAGGRWIGASVGRLCGQSIPVDSVVEKS